MKTIKKSIFSQNLKKGRTLLGWTQEHAAFMAGITRSAWGSYEEDRCFPSEKALLNIAELLHVEDDLYGFISRDDFYDVTGKRKSRYVRKSSLSPIDRKYRALNATVRKAVDALMNLS